MIFIIFSQGLKGGSKTETCLMGFGLNLNPNDPCTLCSRILLPLNQGLRRNIGKIVMITQKHSIGLTNTGQQQFVRQILG